MHTHIHSIHTYIHIHVYIYTHTYSHTASMHQSKLSRDTLDSLACVFFPSTNRLGKLVNHQSAPVYFCRSRPQELLKGEDRNPQSCKRSLPSQRREQLEHQVVKVDRSGRTSVPSLAPAWFSYLVALVLGKVGAFRWESFFKP